MEENDDLLARVRLELEGDFKKPYEGNVLPKTLGISKEEWADLSRIGEDMAEQSAIWSLKVRSLQYLRRKLSIKKDAKKKDFQKKILILAAAVIGGIIADYIAYAGDPYFYGFFASLSYNTGASLILFFCGASIAAGLVWAILRLRTSERRDGLLASLVGLFLTWLTTHGPGRRGVFHWLAHGGAIRFAVGAIGGLLIFEIWRRRKH